MNKKKELSFEKELEAATKSLLFVDSQTHISIREKGKPVNHYKDMVFFCWLDYLILFTKAKKKFPYMVADEFHRIRLNKEKKFEMMQALFKHFLETNQMDSEIRRCLYTIITGTNSLGGRDMIVSSTAPYERYLENHAVKLDIKEQRATQEIAVLFFYYLFELAKAKDNKTKKADVISFFTGFDNESTRQKLSDVHAKANIDFVSFEKDMNIVRRLFEMLGLTQVFTMIDNDLSEQEKETEEKL